MKTLIRIGLIVVLSSFVSGSNIGEAERELAKSYLDSSRDAFLVSIKNLSKEQLEFKGASESWSISECIEHLAITEVKIFERAMAELKTPSDTDKLKNARYTDEEVYKKISTRDYKVKTPEIFKPTGQFKTSREAVDALLKRREETIKYILTTNDDLRKHAVVFNAGNFGTIDCFQMVIFIAGHTVRHTQQINEIKSDPNFPK